MGDAEFDGDEEKEDCEMVVVAWPERAGGNCKLVRGWRPPFAFREGGRPCLTIRRFSWSLSSLEGGVGLSVFGEMKSGRELRFGGVRRGPFLSSIIRDVDWLFLD